MSWAVGYDDRWQRDIGYGVPCLCDHPKCKKEIDRGLAHVCGDGEPYGGEKGCGLYFCEKHGGGSQCPRCRNRRQPYKAKPDMPRWILWKATDESWAEWRKKHRAEVPYVVYTAQGSGSFPATPYWTLGEALQAIEDYSGDASFAIRYPNGKFHIWKGE